MRKLILMFCLVLMAIGAQAQDYDFVRRGQAAKKAGGEQLANFKKEIGQLAKSNNENDLLNAVYGYYGLEDETTAKNLTETAKKRFPKGITMRGSDFQNITNIGDAAAKEKAYKAWLKKYPKKNFKDGDIYGQAAADVANAFAKEGNTDKALSYARQVTDPLWQSTVYTSIASALDKAGKKAEAGSVLKEGCDAVDKQLSSLNDRQKAYVSMVYSDYADWLADNGKADEAWQLYNTKVSEKQRSEAYLKLALQHGQTMQTWTYLDDLLRKGYLDKSGTEIMKEAWTKVNGNADGFDDYVKSVNKNRIDEKLSKVADKMEKKPAPDFTLKDIDGNTVQLSKLRGKVVVLDFWATWCGPCKRSLPAMKKTLEKYKNDPDVVFLFIHTWERGTAEQANKDAKAYLHDNGFDEFHLVMDTVDPETKTNKAVSAFGVNGIPAKFVIDKQGNIRFEISGFGGSDDDAVAELSKMIELARNAK